MIEAKGERTRIIRALPCPNGSTGTLMAVKNAQFRAKNRELPY